MGKFESLEAVKELWLNANLPLGEKAAAISNEFYAAGLDFATTAAYIKATPSELDALLEIGGFDDEVLERISAVNPPKTTWAMLASASDEEIETALTALERKATSNQEAPKSSRTEFFYYAMIEVAEPSLEQKAAALSSDALWHAVTKAEHFDGALNDWETKFLKSVATQKKRGKSLSEKQGASIAKACKKLVDRGILSRQSIDGDQAYCDEIMDALGL